jgi:SAM-dependent methyltransferase
VPAPLKRQGLAEIARVLKPGGRLVIADFTRKQDRAGQAARFHAGRSSIHDLASLIRAAGFERVETEEMRPPRFSAFLSRICLCMQKLRRVRPVLEAATDSLDAGARERAFPHMTA